MGKKLNRVYQALLEGAAEGLSGEALYTHVTDQCPKTSSKRIVPASLLALTDPHVKERGVLEAIYGLAIRYRLASLGVEEDLHEADDDDSTSPSVSAGLRSRLESSVSSLPVIRDDGTPVLSPDGKVH